MTAPRVKICGLRSERDLGIAVGAGADAVGLLCSVPVDSPREIDADRARKLARETPPFVTAVLVTMPNSIADALELVERVDPDAIQLHGRLPIDDVRELTETITVIQALDVHDDRAIHDSEPIADAILLDSTDQQGGGGTGRTHDWDRARHWVDTLDVPVILAGGLRPSNVAEAVEQVRPYAVDVASGVDGENGKDPAAVRSFIAAAHRNRVREGPP